MEKKYYEILGIEETATISQIRQAHRRLSLKYYSLQNTDPVARELMRKIKEAYEALTRKLEDASVSSSRGGGPFNNFENVNRTINHGTRASQGNRTRFESLPNMHGKEKQISMKPIYIDLHVTLEELMEGSTKKKVARQVFERDGSAVIEEISCTIKLSPDWDNGKKVFYRRGGHRMPDNIPGDVIFTIYHEPHAYLKKDGSHLHYQAEISLKDSLYGTVIEVPLPTGKTYLLEMLTDVIDPDKVVKLSGQGLPIPNNTEKCGDLFVSIKVQFPCRLGKRLKDIFQERFPE